MKNEAKQTGIALIVCVIMSTMLWVALVTFYKPEIFIALVCAGCLTVLVGLKFIADLVNCKHEKV